MLVGTLPAGKYCITDPCYVLSDEDYDKLSHNRYFTMKINGHEIAAMKTKYGDGLYDCEERGKFLSEIAVDSGIIGVIPEQLIKKTPPKNAVSFVTFKKSFNCDVDDNGGIIRFGPIKIMTENYDEDAEEWYDRNYYYDDDIL